MSESCKDCNDRANCTARLQAVVNMAEPDDMLSSLLVILLMRTDLQKVAILALEDRALADRSNASAFDSLRYQMKTFIETPKTCSAVKARLKKIFLSGADAEQLYVEMKKDYEHMHSFIELLCEVDRPELGMEVAKCLTDRAEHIEVLYNAAVFDFIRRLGQKVNEELLRILKREGCDAEIMFDGGACPGSSGGGSPFVH